MDPNMDTDVARMMADLGASRRDALSAPQERGSQLSAYDERRILLLAEDRRENAHLQASNDHDAAMIQAWNTASNFSSDTVAESLENRFSGQGHREGLKRTLPTYHGYEESGLSRRARRDVAQDEENRRIYQQNRQARTSAPGTGHQRPPSPRAFGRVRFVNGQRVQAQPGAIAAAASIPRVLPLPAASTSSASSSTGTVTQTQPAIRATDLPTRPPAASAPLPGPTQAPAPPQAQTQAHARAAVTQSSTQKPSGPLTTAQTPAPAAPTARTRILSEITTNVATTGPRSSTMGSTSDPMRQVTASTNKDGVLSSVLARLKGNAENSVQVQPAPVEQRAPNEASTADKAVPVAKTSLDVQAVAGVPNILPIEDWIALSTAPLHRKTKLLALYDAAEKKDCASNWPQDIHFLHEARTKMAQDVAFLAQPGWEQKAKKYFNDHKERAWLQDYAIQARNGSIDNDSDIPMVIEIIKATNQLRGKYTAAPTATAPATSKITTVSTRPPTPPDSASNSRSGSIAGDDSANMSSPAKFETGKGSLGATFYDQNGNLRGNRQYRIDAPVHANVTITAKNGEYDVLRMSDDIDVLANAISRRELIRAQNGYRLSEHGRFVDGQ